jgi:antitoxin YobK
MILDDLERFVSDNSGASIEFGSKDNAPSSDWVKRAEAALGCNLPPSYLWFLSSYGGGEVHGSEIFSIYQLPFEEVVGGDVVAMTLQDRSNGFISETDVAICNTDFGEIFVLDSNNMDANGEFAVVRIVGQQREPYASSFANFLIKFVGNAAV